MADDTSAIATFLNMGGYAFFVWGSYGIVLAVLALNVVVPMISGGSVRRRLRRAALSNPVSKSVAGAAEPTTLTAPHREQSQL